MESKQEKLWVINKRNFNWIASLRIETKTTNGPTHFRATCRSIFSIDKQSQVTGPTTCCPPCCPSALLGITGLLLTFFFFAGYHCLVPWILGAITSWGQRQVAAKSLAATSSFPADGSSEARNQWIGAFGTLYFQWSAGEQKLPLLFSLKCLSSQRCDTVC